MARKFTMIDESFICENCGKQVEPLHYTARDHCPYCLFSLHVDINPGDRLCECKGKLVPVGLKKHRDSYKIVYVCQKCDQRKINIMANDDNNDLIIELSSYPINM